MELQRAVKTSKHLDLRLKEQFFACRSLSKEVGIPPNLKALGAKPEDFPTLAKNAMKDACAQSNPVEIPYDDIVALYQQAYDQE